MSQGVEHRLLRQPQVPHERLEAARHGARARDGSGGPEGHHQRRRALAREPRVLPLQVALQPRLHRRGERHVAHASALGVGLPVQLGVLDRLPHDVQVVQGAAPISALQPADLPAAKSGVEGEVDRHGLGAPRDVGGRGRSRGHGGDQRPGELVGVELGQREGLHGVGRGRGHVEHDVPAQRRSPRAVGTFEQRVHLEQRLGRQPLAAPGGEQHAVRRRHVPGLKLVVGQPADGRLHHRPYHAAVRGHRVVGQAVDGVRDVSLEHRGQALGTVARGGRVERGRPPVALGLRLLARQLRVPRPVRPDPSAGHAVGAHVGAGEPAAVRPALHDRPALARCRHRRPASPPCRGSPCARPGRGSGRCRRARGGRRRARRGA